MFASTTSPYSEKKAAALIATVADLRRDVRTADHKAPEIGHHSHSHGARRNRVGLASSVIVAAADTRLPRPGRQMSASLATRLRPSRWAATA